MLCWRRFSWFLCVLMVSLGFAMSATVPELEWCLVCRYPRSKDPLNKHLPKVPHGVSESLVTSVSLSSFKGKVFYLFSGNVLTVLSSMYPWYLSTGRQQRPTYEIFRNEGLFMGVLCPKMAVQMFFWNQWVSLKMIIMILVIKISSFLLCFMVFTLLLGIFFPLILMTPLVLLFLF